ncbi:VTT domain-containing protein [Patescibacteria group bacterium]|nr:VTT domain-containing protein [Patescibacteria group bacterium]
MLKKLPQIIFFLFLAITLVFIFWQEPINYLQQFVVDNSILSIGVFIFLMFLSTVFAPLTVLPMVPFVALFLGSFNTAVYSIIGWTIGSMVAFWIARHLGKPFLLKLVSEKDIIKYHKYVPQDIKFWWVVFLRMIIPVDILSYIVGLLTDLKAWKYFFATLIGVIPFSFIFSYGYEIVFLKNIPALILSTVFVVAILLSVWYFKDKGRI